jgi:hypothetical protein
MKHYDEISGIGIDYFHEALCPTSEPDCVWNLMLMRFVYITLSCVSTLSFSTYSPLMHPLDTVPWIGSSLDVGRFEEIKVVLKLG